MANDDLVALVNKIKSIQNKQKTLKWGSAETDDEKILIVVGSTAYPMQTQCFVIGKRNEIFLVNDEHKKEILRRCETGREVIECVIGLLKEWFPAKGN